MVFVWAVPLIYILDILKKQKKRFPISHVHGFEEEYRKRIGVYYMCIEDLFL